MNGAKLIARTLRVDHADRYRKPKKKKEEGKEDEEEDDRPDSDSDYEVCRPKSGVLKNLLRILTSCFFPICSFPSRQERRRLIWDYEAYGLLDVLNKKKKKSPAGAFFANCTCPLLSRFSRRLILGCSFWA